jgi:hypothetical protein
MLPTAPSQTGFPWGQNRSLARETTVLVSEASDQNSTGCSSFLFFALSFLRAKTVPRVLFCQPVSRVGRGINVFRLHVSLYSLVLFQTTEFRVRELRSRASEIWSGHSEVPQLRMVCPLGPFVLTTNLCDFNHAQIPREWNGYCTSRGEYFSYSLEERQ